MSFHMLSKFLVLLQALNLIVTGFKKKAKAGACLTLFSLILHKFANIKQFSYDIDLKRVFR